jgi:hypothetical protein
MPRPRPPYLHRVITRHGKAVWYVRLGVGQRKRIRLRSEFGTEDFRLEYRRRYRERRGQLLARQQAEHWLG